MKKMACKKQAKELFFILFATQQDNERPTFTGRNRCPAKRRG